MSSEEKADRLIPRKTYFGNPERTQLRLSPDGGHVAYLAPRDGVMNIWAAPAGSPDAARPLTTDRHRGIRSYSWSFSPGKLLYSRDSDGDENWHVYAVDLDTAEETDLTPLEGVSARIYGMSHRHPERVVLGINDRDPSMHDVWSVDLETGRRELVLRDEGFMGYGFDPDLRLVLGVRPLPDGGIQCLLRRDDGWEELYRAGPEDAMTSFPLAVDVNGRIWLSWSKGRNTSALRSVDPQTGEWRTHAEHPRADLLGRLLVHPRTGIPQAAEFEYERREYRVLDPEVADDLDYLDGLCRGTPRITSRSLDDSRWVAAYLPDNGSPSYWLYDREAGSAELLFRAKPELDRAMLSPMHPVTVEASDGLKLVCYLTMPRWLDPGDGAPPERPLPAVLLVHGGPWARSSWGYRPLCQWLANRGYLVLDVNFRGSTGLGKRHLNAADGEWAGRMHQDLLDARRWAAEEGYADPERTAIMGGSYGGYATLVGLTFTPEEFACGVDIVGPSSLVTLLQNVPPYWMPMMPLMGRKVGALPDTEEGRSYLLERSPLTRAHRIQRPLLIGQGANDPRVTRREADQIVEEMRKKDLPVTYLLYPDEGHGFQRPENRLSFFAVAERFLAEHIGGRCQPVEDSFRGSSVEVLEDGGLKGI
jgi:dipeptidyl aminopeptidase/acylaminoacyl peptidase